MLPVVTESLVNVSVCVELPAVLDIPTILATLPLAEVLALSDALLASVDVLLGGLPANVAVEWVATDAVVGCGGTLVTRRLQLSVPYTITFVIKLVSSATVVEAVRIVSGRFV